MNLENKMIWDLNIEEIEYVYNNLHMNNYVYAALNTFHKSKYPLNKLLKLNKSTAPEPLWEYAEKMLELSPYLGNFDSNIIRVNYTFYAYNLYKSLKEININNINDTIKFLCSIAYIPIISEKNDNFPLWMHKVIRKHDERLDNIYNNIIENFEYEKFISLCLFNNETYEAYINNPLKCAFLIMRAVQSLIIKSENNANKEELSKKWELLEKNSINFEKKYNLLNPDNLGNLLHKGQIRYKNTLYLYGGDFFYRNGDYKKAFDWYLNGIYMENLHSLFGFYLTDMKTIERLICAYRIARKMYKNETKKIKNILDKCMLTVFHNASNYAENILDFISNNDVDISIAKIPDGNRYKLYAGEASREVFLLCLFYNNIVNNIKYENIDYRKFLIF